LKNKGSKHFSGKNKPANNILRLVTIYRFHYYILPGFSNFYYTADILHAKSGQGGTFSKRIFSKT